MKSTIADQKKRIVLPNAQAGEVFGIEEPSPGTYHVVKLTPPQPASRPTRAEVEEAMRRNPLAFKMKWEELKSHTREDS